MKISNTINGSLRLIGVLAAGEDASQTEHEDALERMNGMIDGFNIQDLTISYLQHKFYAEPIGGWKSNITIGVNTLTVINDYNQVAPVSISSAFFRDLGGIDFKMSPMGINEWADMVYKNITAPPKKYFANYHGHNLSLQFDVIPYQSYTLHLMCKTPYVGGYSPTDNIDWDFGFEEMLRYQLAVRLAAEYGVQIRPEIAMLADNLMRNIKRRNQVETISPVDIGLQSRHNKGFYHIGSNSTF
jgi:hypothetical protein